MKLATVQLDDRPPRPAAITPGGVVDLSPLAPDMIGLLDGGERLLDAARERAATVDPIAALADVRLLAPLQPRQLRDFLAFEEHLTNGIRQYLVRRHGPRIADLMLRLGLAKVPARWYDRPLYYKGNRLSVVGPDHDVQWPAYAQRLDYELELAAVIGRPSRDLTEATALDAIVGFTIFNDITARDTQDAEMGQGFHLGPGKSKDFDTGNVLGPWIVTTDELGDIYDLGMTARVDGETWSTGNSGSMHWRWEQIVSHLSQSETLHPGEVIGSGTVGTGCGVEQGRFLHDGAVVELEVTGIGTLRNRIVRTPYTGA